MMIIIIILIIIIITRVPSCKLHDREIAHALPNQRRLRRFGECSSRLGHLVEPNMMSLHASDCQATAKRFPRIFQWNVSISMSRLSIVGERTFLLSRFLVLTFRLFLAVAFSCFLVFSFSCFLGLSFSCFLVFSFYRFLVFLFYRFLVFSFPRCFLVIP